ncbi:MAG: hypothetical protein KF756_13525 [Acidobacteria bacterium]|nr:hypothetical protein [Acidobacteriota bacterium]
MANSLKPIFFVLLTLLLVWAAASLTFPFGWDQGIFAWAGDVIVRGGLPYRDAWDIKGPLTYYTYALAQIAFGKNTSAIRLLDLIILAAAALTIFKVATSFAGRLYGRWAAVIFVLWYASLGFWHTAQPDGWASMFVLFAIGPLIVAERDIRAYYYFPVGLIVGLAVLIKPFYMLFALVAVLDAILRYRKNITSSALASAVLAVGVILPIAATAGWFLYNGAFDVFAETWIVYPSEIYSSIAGLRPFSRATGLVQYVEGGMIISVAWPVIVLGMHTFRRESTRKFVVLLSWLLIAIFCVVLQDRFFQYHWTIVIPSLVLLGTKGFRELFSAAEQAGENQAPASKQTIQAVAYALFVLVVALSTVRPTLDSARWAAHVTGLVDTRAYYSAFADAQDARLAAGYIRERTHPSDKISIWGWDASIAFECDRDTVSRFGYSMPLLMGEGTPQREALRKEFLSALHSDPPAYIVISPQSEVILGKHYSLQDFPQFSAFITQGYAEETRFGSLILFRRQTL